MVTGFNIIILVIFECQLYALTQTHTQILKWKCLWRIFSSEIVSIFNASVVVVVGFYQCSRSTKKISHSHKIENECVSSPTPTPFESWKTRAMTRHWNYKIKKRRYRARYRNSVRWEREGEKQINKTYNNSSSSRKRKRERKRKKSKCSALCEWKCLQWRKKRNKFRTPTSIHMYTAHTHIFLNNNNSERCAAAIIQHTILICCLSFSRSLKSLSLKFSVCFLFVPIYPFSVLCFNTSNLISNPVVSWTKWRERERPRRCLGGAGKGIKQQWCCFTVFDWNISEWKIIYSMQQQLSIFLFSSSSYQIDVALAVVCCGNGHEF